MGAVDFFAFRDALREVDYNGRAMVEQDMYPAPFDKPLPSTGGPESISVRSAWVNPNTVEFALTI